MKKTTQLFLAIAAIAAITFTGCKGGVNKSDPKAVLSAFFERLAKKDLDGAAKLATKDSKSTLDMMKKALEMEAKQKDKDVKTEDPTEEFKNIEYGEPKINGDEASVPAKSPKNDSFFDFPLKKEDGAWKVDFSMSTLMKMGMNGKENAMDQLDNDIDDSLHREEAQRISDSIIGTMPKP